MSWACQLDAAMAEGFHLPYAAGQEVEIRTRAGALVARGVVLGVSDETRSVMIMDRASGTDLQIELDPKMYDIRKMTRGGSADVPSLGIQPSLSSAPSRPGRDA
jgi:hypothetical protein